MKFAAAGDAIIGSIYMLKQGMEIAELMDYESGEYIKVKLALGRG